MDPYGPLLAKTRVPQPSLQQLAVISLFSKIRSADRTRSSEHESRAISHCLLSASPAVVDQSVRELCRLAADFLIDISACLLELQSSLEGSDPKFASLFVKGIGFVVRLGFRERKGEWQFGSAECHPFVRVLVCRAEGEDELVRQVLLFIVKKNQLGMARVCEFLRPFLTYSILRIPFANPSSSLFVTSLLASMASLSCSLLDDVVPMFRLLTGCLRIFPLKNADDFKNLLNFVERMVEAHVLVLRQLSGIRQVINEVQRCSIEMLKTMLDFCGCPLKYSGVKEAFIELSKHLLLAHMDLNLEYIPEVSAVTLSLFSLLTQSTLEHEQIPILELALHIFKWKANAESLLDSPARALGVEILFIFPVISLVSSPSKSIKGAASELILMLEKMTVKLLVGPKTDLGAEEEIPSDSGPGKIVFRLLQHLWIQDLITTSIFAVDIFAFTGTNTLKSAPTAGVPWMHRLMEHSSCIVDRKKTSLPGTEAQIHVSAEMPMLICSVANVLVTHPSMGPAAVDVLTAMGVVDPKAGVTLLLAVLFFNGLYNKDIMGGELMLKVLGMLPQLASHSSMIPLIIQTLTPLLSASRPVLYGTATRLLCQTWAISDQAFVRLQGILAPEHFKDGSLEKSVCLSIASSIQDVCRKNPDRGVDLILSISACIETQDSLIQALGFQSLAYLCEADVVDFYTAWDVIEKQMLDYSNDPFLACSVSLLLRWGVMDAEVYQEASRHVVQILWDIGTSTHLDKKIEWSKARASAWNALVQYEISHILGIIPELKERSICSLISERDDNVLGAMEQLLVKIILHEHMNRRRLLKVKNTGTNKIEKLLDVLPQVIFSSGKKDMKKLPGAVLICYSLSPKDFNRQETTTVGNDQYEETFIEIAASFQLSRNILIALLSLQSWKSFMRKWISAKALSFEERASIQVLDRTSKAANVIMKSVIRIAEASLPRSAENIALALGALCAVLPPSVHTVKSAASKFLLGWLSQSKHEHRQWSAAISLGAISSRLHVTDCKQKVLNISGLIEVLSNSKSGLVKGACGIGLGLSSQDLLPNAMAADAGFNRDTSKVQDMILIGNIIRSLSSVLLNVTRSSSKIFRILSEYIPRDLHDGGGLFNSASYCEDIDLMEEDVWGVAGLVIGLGSSIGAVYRCGDVDTVLSMKEMIISLIPFQNPSAEKSSSHSEGSEMLLYAGSCLALPLIVGFCQRVELIDTTDIEVLLNGYRNIISELLSVQNTGSFHQSLLMASCVGSGSLLACLANEDSQHIEFDSIIKFLDLFRSCYTSPRPPAICLGGMLGVVNSLGAEAGVWMDGTRSLLNPHSTVYQKESSSVMHSLLSHPVCESFLISIVQEMFLIAQNPNDEQLRNYATWTLSLLRRMWSEEDLTTSYSAENARDGFKVASQSFSTDSVVMKLSLWLKNLPKVTSAIVGRDEVEHVKIIGTVLKCLSQAPRLPDMDWGAIVRRCMRLDIQGSRILPSDLTPQKGMLREEALRFALAHASHSDHLLGFLDDLTDLARFRMLELNLQSCLILHLPDLLKSFSRSRLEKLFFDMNDYLGSMNRDNHSPPDRRRLRISTWNGLHQCLDETSPDIKENLPNFERCIEVIFSLLPESWLRTAEETDNPSCVEEWSVAVRCLEKAPMDWLLNFLQVDLTHWSDRFNEKLKKIVMKAKLVRTTAVPLTELVKLKMFLLNFPPREIWQVLIEFVAALQHAEGNVKRQWLAEAAEISCASKYPTTAVGFVGMLSGSCGKYMPILMLDQRSVLCDLPVTITSLLSLPTWTIIAERFTTALFASSERIYSWVTRSMQIEVDSSCRHNDIDESERASAPFLLRVMHASCILLRDYLPLDKQIRLTNMVVG